MLELVQVTKNFTNNPGYPPAVNEVSLEIRDGEFFSLLGPSGCGKTTLLRMIAGFETPTSGQILHNRERMDVLPPNARPFNLVFQRYALFPHLNVLQNIEFGLRLKKLTTAEIKSRTDEILSLVKMEGYELRLIGTLSGGQQQRIALARALVNRPRILLLDEPLSALDLKLRQQMQVELRSIQRRLKHTFIFVTHDQEEAMALSDRIAVMNDGKVEQVGEPKDIYDRPETLFVANFIGTANLLEAEVLEVSSKGEVVLKNPFSGTGHSRQVSGFRADQDFKTGDRVKLVLRPERIQISHQLPQQLREVESRNFMKISVKDALFQGATTHVYVQPQGKSDVHWTVSVPNLERTEIGVASAYVSWNWQDAKVLPCR